MEQFVNPIKKRNQAEYNLRTEEQKQLIDGYENLAKEYKYIIPIKRCRKPELSEGVIFAICLPSHRYVYGKILAKTENLPMIDNNNYIVMITNVVSDNLEEVSFELSEANIIAGPWIVTDTLWKNGKFTTVGRRPISDSEKLLDVGFYRIEYIPDGGTLKESGYLVDLHGNRIEQEPVYIHSCGYITIDGIEQNLYKNRVLGKI